MIAQLIQVLVIAVVAGIVWWICDYLPVPEPLNKLIKVVTVVIAAIAVILVLLRLAGISTVGV